MCTQGKQSCVWLLHVCVFSCVRAAGEGRLVFALEDCVTSFIPVRTAGIICNLTSAGCQKATNKPYGYVCFPAPAV